MISFGLGFLTAYVLTGIYYGMIIRCLHWQDRLMAVIILIFLWPWALLDDLK